MVFPAGSEARDGEHVIGHRRAVHPELHAEGNQHAKIAVFRRSGRNDHADAQTQHRQLQQEHRGHKNKPVRVHAAVRQPEVDHKANHKRKLDREVDQLRQHSGDRHDKAREIDLAQDGAVGDESVRSRRQAGGKVRPDNVRRQVEDKGRHTVGGKSGDPAEHQGEHHGGQQRLDHRPGRAEDRLLVERNEIALDKQKDQILVAYQFPQVQVEPPTPGLYNGYISVFVHVRSPEL